MQLSGIRAISFDLDDTLWPFQPCVARAEAALLTWLRVNAPGTCGVLSAPSDLRSYRAQAEAAHPELHLDLSGLRRASIRAILAAGGEDPERADEAFEVFFEERLRVDLYPDVLPALEQLSQRYPLVGLSNGNGCVHKAGLTPFFKGSLSAMSLGVAKPQAEAFHAAAQLAGVQASELLHVGDDWRLDVLGALGAGVQAAWVVRGPHERMRGDASASPHAVVADLHELCAALEH